MKGVPAMKFTGNGKRVFSTRHKQFVTVLEYRSDSNVPYMECSRCGKDIKRVMYVVQDPETGISMERLCAACARRI